MVWYRFAVVSFILNDFTFTLMFCRGNFQGQYAGFVQNNVDKEKDKKTPLIE